MNELFSGKRTLHHMRDAFQHSPWLHRISLRYMARKIKENELQKMDEMIGSRTNFEDQYPAGDRNRKRMLLELRSLVDQTPGVPQVVLKCLARKLGVENLEQLERMIGTLRKNPCYASP